MIRNLLSNALEIYHARKGVTRLSSPQRRAEHRDLGYRRRHPQRRTSDDLRRIPSARQRRARAQPAASALVFRSYDVWPICSATVCASARSRARARFSRSTSSSQLSSAAVQVKDRQPEIDETIAEAVPRTGAVLIIEDDPEVCNFLDLLLKDQGCHTATAPDGIAALDLVARGEDPA